MSVTGEHDECMICLGSLLQAEEDSDDEDNVYIETSVPEIGAVWPCGHCFHLKCWNQWNKDKCPCCNQHASLFSKIFISAPPPKKPDLLSEDERAELERYRQAARQQVGGSERMLLRDMERSVHGSRGAADAKIRHSMTQMMMVNSRDLRKAERALKESKEDHGMTKDILACAQRELEQAHSELNELKPKNEQLQKQIEELQREQEANDSTTQSERDRKKIAQLQEKLEKYKEKLIVKNRQLVRRNKELAAKKKAQRAEMATKVEEQKVSRRTTLELERTKKELELLKELDSFTMNDSEASLGLSVIW